MNRINVDLDLCQGHGRCYRIAPQIMQPIDDSGHAEYILGSLDGPEAQPLSAARSAVDSCPEAALTAEFAAESLDGEGNNS
jgi:ferredoxin